MFSLAELCVRVLQAHHCRSMIPCQDSPSIKHTYYAQVTHTNTNKCTVMFTALAVRL